MKGFSIFHALFSMLIGISEPDSVDCETRVSRHVTVAVGRDPSP